jgi:hypothetical protein
MNSTVRRIVLLLTLFFLLGEIAAAASPVPAGRLVRTEGEVTVRYAGSDDFVSVWRHERVGPGDTLATGPGGLAELSFPDGTRLVIGSSARLLITDIAPRRSENEGDRVVLDISVRLDSGAIRAAAPMGPAFTLSMGAGTITLATSPETGADITAAMGVFAWGEYAQVTEGCAFFTDHPGRPITLCAVNGLPSGLRFGGGAPIIVDGSLIDLAFSEEIPPIRPDARPVGEITVDGRTLAHGADGAFHLPGTARDVSIEGTADNGRIVVITAADGAIRGTVMPDQNGQWRYGLGPVPADGYTLTIETVYTGSPPPGLAAAAEGTPVTPSPGTPAKKEEKIDPDAVASRFVQAFSGALSRGDTGALAGLVSPDYNGVAGGSGRSALLAGVSEFFTAGGTLSVSAYATGASLAGDTVIATMSFSSRVNGAPKSGNLRLWLTGDGMLTHAEGQWVF